MPVPSENDWGDYASDVDQKYAHDLFAGRTTEEMQPHFRRNVIERTDELRFMPPMPFQYYMLGFRDFVMSGDFGDNFASDVASCFLGLVAEKLEKQSQDIVPIMPDLMTAVEYVAQNQDSYEAEQKIYGNFLEKLCYIQNLYSKCLSS